MRVAIIGTVGVPANYGGFETLVENLITNRQNPDITYQVYCSSKAYKVKQKQYKGAFLHYLPFKANGWQALVYDNLSLIHAYFTADTILALGGNLWVLPLLRLLGRKRVINNFDGLDCTRDKWNTIAKLVMSVSTKLTARFVDIGIADNQAIQEYLEKTYRKNVVLIEYGGDNAKPVKDDRLLLQEYSLTPNTYAFKVARIEPENNIALILEAFCQLPDQTLVVVGNWNKSDFGRNIREKYTEFPNLRLLDPIYDSDKLNLLRSNCRLYVHGHSVGGTNPSLVEAMNLGLAILAFDVKYNRATTEDKAIYFNSANALVTILQNVSELNTRAIGEQMAEIAQRRYTWQTICRKYETQY